MIWAEATAGHPDAHLLDPEHQVARTAYTTAHLALGVASASTYLVTKAIGAGAMLVAALLVLLGHAGAQASVGVLASPDCGRLHRADRRAAGRRPQAAGPVPLHPHLAQLGLVADAAWSSSPGSRR